MFLSSLLLPTEFFFLVTFIIPRHCMRRVKCGNIYIYGLPTTQAIWLAAVAAIAGFGYMDKSKSHICMNIEQSTCTCTWIVGQCGLRKVTLESNKRCIFRFCFNVLLSSPFFYFSASISSIIFQRQMVVRERAPFWAIYVAFIIFQENGRCLYGVFCKCE